MAALLLLCGALQGIVGILVVISVQVIQPNFQQPEKYELDSGYNILEGNSLKTDNSGNW